MKKMGYGFGVIAGSSLLANKSYAQDSATIVFHVGETYVVDGISHTASSVAQVAASDMQSQAASAEIVSVCTTVNVNVFNENGLNNCDTSCVPTAPQDARCWWLSWLFGLCD